MAERTAGQRKHRNKTGRVMQRYEGKREECKRREYRRKRRKWRKLTAQDLLK